jgi:hypothetical protein
MSVSRPAKTNYRRYRRVAEFALSGGSMVDREKVLAVLVKRFPGASPQAMAAAANAIVGLEDEWEEVTDRDDELGYHYSAQCTDICFLAQQVERGDTFRLFRRRAPLKR